jgi:AbrB family looped-hinge helix DNA binding protein
MNALTRMSGKGQVVVPKDVRDRLGWLPGEDLEVIESADGVTFRRQRRGKTLSVQEAVARLRVLYRHEGPPVPIDQLSWSPGWDREDPGL